MLCPTFTVIIPVYNRSHSIGDTLLSVKNQTFEDFECIVVDDGSDDGLALSRVVDELSDQRFIYLRQENGGGGAARNRGIEAAKGLYIAFLDSDDFFLPTKLEKVLPVLGSKEPVVIYSQNLVRRDGAYWVRPDRAIRPGERVATYLFIENQFIQTSTIVLAAWLAKKVRFDPALRKGQDLDFCVRLQAAGASFEMYPDPLSIWSDDAEGGRTSRVAGYLAPERWLASMSEHLSPNEIRGYRATSLSYYYGWARPGRAVHSLVGGLRAGVPLKVLLRSSARTFLPRTLYRRMVNVFVRVLGARKERASALNKSRD